jgi:predicted HTH transcriptional regulator
MLNFLHELRDLEAAVAADEAAQQCVHSKQPTAVHENQRLLLTLLREHGPMTAVQCTEMTGLREINARWHLRALVERGEAILINTGTVRRYGLPEHRST